MSTVYTTPKSNSLRYHSFLDHDSDPIYILPFHAKTIQHLINIEDEDLREFLYSELGTNETVLCLNSDTIFSGSDIQDHL